MNVSNYKSSKGARINFFLSFAVLLFFCVCLYGINWGLVESWNPDQMALGKLITRSDQPLRPASYVKPPLHAYFNYFFAEIPARILSKSLNLTTYQTHRLLLIFSRLLTILLFISCGYVIYLIVYNNVGDFEAKCSLILFYSSAGVLSFAHFLTSDIPVTFWMLLTFLFCVKISKDDKLKYYIIAGILTGIATATKYNGLAIGVCIPVSHLLRNKVSLLKFTAIVRSLFAKHFLVSMTMVIFGFILAHPYSVLDYKKFISGFLFYYRVTPVYDGSIGKHSYLEYFYFFTELLGWPAIILVVFSLVFYVRSFKKNNENFSLSLTILCVSILLLYYLKFGAFPRQEARFILPIVPYLIILFSPVFGIYKKSKKIYLALLLLVFVYNFGCCLFVGYRFNHDPRMKAIEWVSDNIKSNFTILNSFYCPDWNKIRDKNYKIVALPFISGRSRLFKTILKKDNPILTQNYNKEEYSVFMYSKQFLKIYNPDFISVNSIYYDRFLDGGDIGRLYPNIRAFFEFLLKKNEQYEIVFDKSSVIPPKYVYPREIDCLNSRMTILKKIEPL